MDRRGAVIGGLLTGLIGCDAPASGQAVGENARVLSELASGYRDWPLISLAHEAGKLNDLRAILGNEIAIKATRAGTLPYPDGAIIARLAWDYHPLEESLPLWSCCRRRCLSPDLTDESVAKALTIRRDQADRRVWKMDWQNEG